MLAHPLAVSPPRGHGPVRLIHFCVPSEWHRDRHAVGALQTPMKGNSSGLPTGGTLIHCCETCGSACVRACACVCEPACWGRGMASGKSVQHESGPPCPQHGGRCVRGGVPPGGRDPPPAYQQRLHDLRGAGCKRSAPDAALDSASAWGESGQDLPPHQLPSLWAQLGASP